MNRSHKIISMLLVMCTASLCITNVLALRQSGDYPWKNGRVTWQEKEMFDAIGPAWYLPIGPTGIRAQITDAHPQYFTVKYVFKKSPAAEKINIGDIVVGANGTMLKRPHSFAKRSQSWDGPLVDMAKLIEDSQGKDGKLELIVWPGGKKADQKTVAVQIEAVGRFSETFPFNCKRTEKLIDDLCIALASDLERKDASKGGLTSLHMILALMASGDKKYDSTIKAFVRGMAKMEPNPRVGGKANWSNSYKGIIFGEYYKLTKDKSVLPVMKLLAQYYDDAMDHGRGAYSHHPTPSLWITNAKGYGAMAAPAGLSMLAMSTFKGSGVEISEKAYNELHQSYLRAATPDGVRFAYCFPSSPDHASITLEDPDKAKTDAGPGFRVPTGMKGIGKYTVGWPTPKENRGIHLGPSGTDTSWIEKEKDTNDVYMFYKNAPNVRVVVRNYNLPEPTKPYKTTIPCAQAPVGLGALANAIGNKDKSWQYLATHCGNSSALAYGTWFDGHASAGTHQLWVGLGAARAEKENFRKFMDGVKWWFIMQQTHDGTYLNCPNRDRPTGANKNYGPHTMSSSNAALILSVSRKVLQITGASADGVASNPKFKSKPGGSKPAGRKARQLLPEKRTLLDKSLQMSLAKLSRDKKLKPLPMTISKAQAKVWLAKIETDSKLTFQAMKGDKQASFEFTDLTANDHALLSRLVARFQPENKEAQVTAGIYMEINGNTTVADEYYKKAGSEVKEKLEALFE